MTDIHILSAARTAIGGFGGSLSSLPPIDIATHAAKAALSRAGVNVINSGRASSIINYEVGVFIMPGSNQHPLQCHSGV